MTQEAMKLALEALKCAKVTASTPGNFLFFEEAITAIKEALAQPALYMAVSNDRISVDPHTGNVSIGSPPQRKPLTDEEIMDLCRSLPTTQYTTAFARAIEAAHGIKE